MSYIPQQQFQQMPGTTVQQLPQYPRAMTAQQYPQRIMPNQHQAFQQANVPITQKHPQKKQMQKGGNVHYPQYKQPQQKHNRWRGAPGMIAGTAAATAIANTVPMPGHGFSRTAGKLGVGLVGGRYVGKNVNRFVNRHW